VPSVGVVDPNKKNAENAAITLAQKGVRIGDKGGECGLKNNCNTADLCCGYGVNASDEKLKIDLICGDNKGKAATFEVKLVKYHHYCFEDSATKLLATIVPALAVMTLM